MDSKQLLQKLIEKLSANPTADTKKQLQKLIEQVKTKQFREGEAKGLTETIGEEIVDQLQPTFESLGKELTKNISTSVEKAIKGIKVDVPTIDAPKVSVNVPDVIVPPFPDFPEIPTPQVTVNVPPFPMIPPFPKIPDFPKIEMPETMKVFGQVEIANNDYKNPLMVQLIDLKGRPYESVGGGAFGGGVHINNSTDEPIPVIMSSGVTVTLSAESITLEHDTDSVTTLQLSGSIDSVYVTGVATTLGTNILDSAGNYRDTFPISGTVTGITNTIGVYNLDSAGNYKDTYPVSGSVAVSGITGSIGATILNGEGVARDSWAVSGITNTVGVYNLDSAGNYKDSYPITGTVTGITNTIATANIDSSGIQYSGSNPMPVTTQRALESLGLDVLSVRQVSGASHSVNVLGFSTSIGATILNGEGVARDSWLVSDITNSIKTALVDSSGVQYSGSNPVPVTIQRALESLGLDVMTTRQVSGASDSVTVLSGTITTVTGITNSLQATLIDSSGVGYSGSNPVPVVFGASSSQGVAILDSSGVQYSGSNPVPVVFGASATQGVMLVDSTGVAYEGANPIPVTITSGATATTAVQNLNADGTYRDTFPVSGTITGITNSTATTILNGDGTTRESWAVTGTLTGITNTIATANIDSSGIQYSGSNPMPVTSQRALESIGLDVMTVRQVSGASHSVNVLGFSTSIGATILNGEGLARDTWGVSGITNSVGVTLLGSDGLGFTTSKPVPVTYVSGVSATLETRITDSTGVAFNGDNPIPVRMVTGAFGTVGVSLLGSDGLAFGTTKPVPVTMVDGVSGTTGCSIVGSNGLAYGTSNPVPVTMVAGVSGTTGTANVDSSGVQYSGSNPMPTYLVAGAGNSTVSVGVTVADAVDDGSAPIKNGGIARTANPTAVAGGDIVTYSADDLGRQICRPVNARDLIATAYVSKATGSTFGTETTLLAATAGAMYDLIYVVGTNDSSAGIQCDLRGVTAGNVLLSLYLPPTGTAGIAMPVPLPQTTSDTGNAWTIDLPDVTGTNVIISALFTKEV